HPQTRCTSLPPGLATRCTSRTATGAPSAPSPPAACASPRPTRCPNCPTASCCAPTARPLTSRSRLRTRKITPPPATAASPASRCPEAPPPFPSRQYAIPYPMTDSRPVPALLPIRNPRLNDALRPLLYGAATASLLLASSAAAQTAAPATLSPITIQGE